MRVECDSVFKPDLVADDSGQHDENGTNTEPRAEVSVRLPTERPLLEQAPPDEHDRSSQRLQTLGLKPRKCEHKLLGFTKQTTTKFAPSE